MQPNNPVGTDGFDFLEFSTTSPEILEKQFLQLGFCKIAKHKTYDIQLYQQGAIRFIINNSQHSKAQQFASEHGPSACGMAFRVKDAQQAWDYVIANGATPYTDDCNPYGLHAIQGVGKSFIYFVEYKDNESNYDQLFQFAAPENNQQASVNLTYLDHVTHNLYRGNMDKLAEFYQTLFNFKQIRYFDIHGQLTGLKSRAMTSPCGKIRIPLNESSDDKSQIEEFLSLFHGEGIQHIALGTNNIYHSVKQLTSNGIEFLSTPDTYYELLEKRLPDHGEPLAQLQQLRILMDGSTEPDVKILLQIFTQNMLGPVFFEVICRKGDEGFGEGNFRALFESIELDQIRRGVLHFS
jgi:4-hydroxyphenylpyruvate dioxygenase